MSMTVNEKIALIREKMNRDGVDAIIVPSGDPHMSEYSSDHWKTRAFVSGFSGSAGTVVITRKESGLWTDGRYYVQAAAELEGSEMTLFRASEKDCPSYYEYLYQQLEEGAVIGLNSEVFSAQLLKQMEKRWNKKHIEVRGEVDYANEIWEDRPNEDLTEIFYLEEKYSGLNPTEKMTLVREKLAEADADAIILSKLDNIAWLFNIRSSDIPFNPVVISYAYLSKDKAILFTDDSRMPAEVKAILAGHSVEVRPYAAIYEMIASVTETTAVLCDITELNAKLYRTALDNKAIQLVYGTDPIFLLKSRKTDVETKNTYTAYLEDGCALAEFYGWLEERMDAGDTITEYDLVDKLVEFRSQQEGYRGESFPPIIGYQENAAMMHYAPHETGSKVLEKKDLLLIDNGGQYLYGTTDTTRTFAMGTITELERHDFTLVLKSVIALTNAVFKDGTSGAMLDCLSRVNLWRNGQNYRCGTGHGVGYMLNVHEGPQGFGSPVPLEEGMNITIEPGIYTEGSHGIRTENAVTVVKGDANEYGQFYHFDTFTRVPIDIKCIEVGMMTPDELKWVNDYHKLVYSEVAPLVSERARKWLEKKTREI